jgi:hypothetical protein
MLGTHPIHNRRVRAPDTDPCGSAKLRWRSLAGLEALILPPGNIVYRDQNPESTISLSLFISSTWQLGFDQGAFVRHQQHQLSRLLFSRPVGARLPRARTQLPCAPGASHTQKRRPGCALQRHLRSPCLRWWKHRCRRCLQQPRWHGWSHSQARW